MSKSLGLLLVFAGAALVLAGILVWVGGLGWFGRLPGDIRVEGETTRFYIPITSMLVLSLVLSLLIALLRRLF